MYKNHCSHPDILLLNCPKNATFSERGMPPDPPGGVNPLFKKILDPPLMRMFYLAYQIHTSK